MDKNSRSLTSISYFSQLSTKAKDLFEKIKKEKNDIDSEKFVCVKTDGAIFNFNKVKNSLDLALDIYRNKSLLKNGENKQNKIKILLNKLIKYSTTNLKKIKAKKETLSAAFKTGIFPYIDGFQIKEETEEESEEERVKKVFKYIEKESKGINCHFFKTYFNFSVPSALVKQLYETKDKKKNNELVKEIQNRWSGLKDEIEKMSEDEKKMDN